MNTAALDVCKKAFNIENSSISLLGNGLINDTFLVSDSDSCFILQKINTLVFPKPKQIIDNLKLLNKHINQKKTSEVKLKVPGLIQTINQQYFYLDENNDFWRALEFIDNTESKESISRHSDAQQVGFALGHFHQLFCDINTDLFHDTLPGFHITPHYFQQYQMTKKHHLDIGSCQKSLFCEHFINSNQSQIAVLETAKKNKLLSERIIHGDPKLNNFLFDKQSHAIISLIDLDTVKPGLVHYDIADCLRSCCHNDQSNHFELNTCEIILNSYLKQTADFFTPQDYDFLYPAIHLIPFELGMRFYTDFLKGNQYFKVKFPEHNLDRALAQFKLCESIAKQESKIKQLIFDYQRTHS